MCQVVRAAESCAATMAGVLPAEMVVRVLNPIVKTGDFPVNQVVRHSAQAGIVDSIVS